MMFTQIKSLFHCLLFFTLLGVVPLYALPERYHVIAQETIKDFQFQEDQPWIIPAKNLSFSSFLSKKRVVILHFWATSCPSCITELKHLNQIANTYKNADLDFIVLSLNDPRSGVLRNYFNRSRYTHLKPYHNASSTRPPIKGLPTTLFFNKQGKLIGRIEGPAKWHTDEMRRLLNRLTQEKEPTNTGYTNFCKEWIQKVVKWFS